MLENQEMKTVRFGFQGEFYLENQWKSALLRVFLENTAFPEKVIESNLFKGLFYQSGQK